MVAAGNTPCVDIDLPLITRGAVAGTEVSAEALSTVGVADVCLGRD